MTQSDWCTRHSIELVFAIISWLPESRMKIPAKTTIALTTNYISHPLVFLPAARIWRYYVPFQSSMGQSKYITRNITFSDSRRIILVDFQSFLCVLPWKEEKQIDHKRWRRQRRRPCEQNHLFLSGSPLSYETGNPQGKTTEREYPLPILETTHVWQHSNVRPGRNYHVVYDRSKKGTLVR